jgi:hypothetical protein
MLRVQRNDQGWVASMRWGRYAFGPLEAGGYSKYRLLACTKAVYNVTLRKIVCHLPRRTRGAIITRLWWY